MIKRIMKSTTNTALWLALIAFTILTSFYILFLEKQALGDVANNFNPLQQTQTQTSSSEVLGYTTTNQNDSQNRSNEYSYWLAPDSVVLITGAAGFLGSQLAVALFRTFGVTNLICIDNLAKSYLDVSDGGTLDPDELSQFEFKRQRMNYVLQTVPSAEFYVADFRPTIPEFFEVGEVPILDTIFRKHRNITHVVHFADSQQYWSSKGVAVPYNDGDTKTGMIEVLFEQIKKARNETGKTPHFLYASSYEVYKGFSFDKNNSEAINYTETDVLSTPGSLHGASKLIDEILAASYFSIHNIFSVALRFFPVYGPWGSPGSPLFEMAEKIVSDQDGSIIFDDLSKPHPRDLVDHVYIDDAIDLIMSAMQFYQKGAPAVFNVGTNKPVSLHGIAKKMKSYFPPTRHNKILDDHLSTISKYYSASIEEARKKLNWKPQYSLDDGISKLLAWHWDRNNPYGIKSEAKSLSKHKNFKDSSVLGCNPFDNECLKGHTVFPCISECSNPNLCLPSIYDEVAKFSRQLTEGCNIVLYTVMLNPDASDIPSGRASGRYNASSYVKSSKGSCNIAFISETSPLWKKTRKSSKSFGFWELLPVPLLDENHPETYTPKYSPGNFFAKSVSVTIYSSPDIVMKDIQYLADKLTAHPAGGSSSTKTISIVPRKKENSNPMKRWYERAQEANYNKVKMVMIGRRFKKENEVASTWIAHKLHSQVGKSFRCDVFGENLRWNINYDEKTLNFVLSLHDIWSRMLLKWSSEKPWWVDRKSGDDFYISIISSGEGDRIVIVDDSEKYATTVSSAIDDDQLL